MVPFGGISIRSTLDFVKNSTDLDNPGPGQYDVPIKGVTANIHNEELIKTRKPKANLHQLPDEKRPELGLPLVDYQTLNKTNDGTSQTSIPNPPNYNFSSIKLSKKKHIEKPGFSSKTPRFQNNKCIFYKF